MKKQILLSTIIPVLFLVFCQNSFGQVKQNYGFYYTYDLRRSDDPAIEIRNMPFYLGSEPEWCKRFFEDTLPFVKYLKESKTYEVYDSVYKFYGFMGDAKQKHLDSMFLTMCSPDARVTPGDSVKIIYLNTKNVEVFNYDLRVAYYNGKIVRGLVWYQIKNSKLFGRYKIEGNNTTIEDDPFDVTVKSMIGYESVKRRLAKLVPVKPVTTGAITYTEERKRNGKIVVKIPQDGEPAFMPKFDSLSSIAIHGPKQFSVSKPFPAKVNAHFYSYDLPKVVILEAEKDTAITSIIKEVDEALAENRKLLDRVSPDDKAITLASAQKAERRADSIAQVRKFEDSVKTARLDSAKNAKAEALAQAKQRRADLMQIAKNKNDRENALALKLQETSSFADSIARVTKKKEDTIRYYEKLAKEDAWRKRQKRIKDSTESSQKEIAIANAKIEEAKKLQAIKDEIYRRHLQRIEDSTKQAIAKHFNDSVAEVKRIADSTAFVISELKRLYDSVTLANESLQKNAVANKVPKKEYRNEEDEMYAKSDLPEVTMENGKLKIIPPEGGSENPIPQPVNAYRPPAKRKPPPVIIIYRK